MKRSIISIPQDSPNTLFSYLPDEMLQKIFMHQLDLQLDFIDALHYHVVNKIQFNKWCNVTYLRSLIEKMINRNKKCYTENRHASFVSSLYRLRRIDKSLHAASNIISYLPDLHWIMQGDSPLNVHFPLEVKISDFFTTTGTKNKRINNNDLVHLIMIKRYIHVRYGWNLVISKNDAIVWRNATSILPPMDGTLGVTLL